jgi:hypothetical protein
MDDLSTDFAPFFGVLGGFLAPRRAVLRSSTIRSQLGIKKPELPRVSVDPKGEKSHFADVHGVQAALAVLHLEFYLVAISDRLVKTGGVYEKLFVAAFFFDEAETFSGIEKLHRSTF